MTYRRRQRWLRRLALGFAFATALFAGRASLAAAVVDEGGSQATQVVSQAPSGDELAIQNAISSVPSTPARPDDRAVRFTGGEQPQVIRPDDRADRFSPADVATPPEPASSGWNVEWNEALSFGIGGLALALAIGLGLGYLRRPRLAL